MSIWVFILASILTSFLGFFCLFVCMAERRRQTDQKGGFSVLLYLIVWLNKVNGDEIYQISKTSGNMAVG